MSSNSDDLKPIPMINGLDCPACGHPTLFLGNGGYITCALERCPNPDYAEALEISATNKAIEAETSLIDFAMRHYNEHHDACGLVQLLQDRRIHLNRSALLSGNGGKDEN